MLQQMRSARFVWGVRRAGGRVQTVVMNDVPPELRGVSPDPVRERTTPPWVQLTALVLIVAMVAFALYSVF